MPSFIYQISPLLSFPGPFKEKGWTNTLDGYLYEANKLARCIIRNRCHYPWEMSINIEAELTIDEHKKLWAKACRVLKKRGMIALWIREPSATNRIHYHLI